VYRPGQQHLNADALSRIPSCHQCDIKHVDQAAKHNVKVFDGNTSHSTENQEQVLLLSGFIPEHWNQGKDLELNIIIQLMRSGVIQRSSMPDVIKAGSSSLKELWRQRQHLRLRGDALYIIQEDNYKFIVPTKERIHLIHAVHSSVGHAGVSKVLYALRDHYYWPRIGEDVTTQINQCFQCQLMKGNPCRIRAPLQSTIVGEPFERIAIDISGPFHHCGHGHRFILAVIDYFSKYCVLIPLRRVDAETVARKIISRWITVFGVPIKIHSDRGSNFESELFHELCNLLGILKTKTSPYYPQSDGLVERLFRTVKPMISAVVHERRMEWCEALSVTEMGLRATVQESTGFSPFEILFGKRMRLPWQWQNVEKLTDMHTDHTSYGKFVSDLRETLQQIRNKVEVNLKRSIQRQEVYYNKNKRSNPFTVGDKVLVRIERHSPLEFPLKKYEGPFVIIKNNGHWSYTLQHTSNDKKIIQRNFNQLKRWKEDSLKGNLSQKLTKTRKSKNTSIETVEDRTRWKQDRVRREIMRSRLSSQPTTEESQTSLRPAIVNETHTRYPTRARRPPSRLGFQV
jgi:transposase InsO family protein